MNQKGYIYVFCSPEVKLLYNTDFIEKQLILYCNKNNIKIIGIITDVINDRPNLSILLNKIDKERLICWSVSQLSWDIDGIMAIRKKLCMINLNILTLPQDINTSVGYFMLTTAAASEEYIYDIYLKNNNM